MTEGGKVVRAVSLADLAVLAQTHADEKSPAWSQ